MSVRARRVEAGTVVGGIALVVYGAGVFLANWMIRNVGLAVSGGTHLLPVGFGLMAPSGTYCAALVLVARDVVQRTIGKRWSLLVIVPGVLLTAVLDPRLALASGAAFGFGELADFAVYTPLSRRGLGRAVFASACCGAGVDSVVFLGLAGIPFAVALPGLLLGKVWVALAACILIAGVRRAVPVGQHLA